MSPSSANKASSYPHTAADQAQLEALRAIVRRSAQAAKSSAPVRAKAAQLLLDTLGCVLAGRRQSPVQQLESALSAMDQGLFRFPGGPPLSTQAAASIAAMSAAWDEACEGLPYAHGRPGLALVGALLPLAVARNAPLDHVLESLIAGYEVGGRAGGWMRIRPGMHVDGNWPAFGVAAGVAHLIGLTDAQRWTALALVACQLPTSLYLPIRTGDNGRNTYLSHCAALGTLAALSAGAGITAPERALLDYARDDAVTDGSAAPSIDRALILEAYFKPHAGVRHAHYGLEAAMQIRERLGRTSAGVSAIHLRIYEEAATYAGNRDPQAPITGQFSLSLGVAAGLRYGGMSPSLFQPYNFHDPELRRLERLVQIEPDPVLGAGGARAAVLTVVAADQSHEARVDRLDGDAANPLSQGRLIEKFQHYAEPCVARDVSNRFATAVLDPMGAAGFGTLWSSLTTTPG